MSGKKVTRPVSEAGPMRAGMHCRLAVLLAMVGGVGLSSSAWAVVVPLSYSTGSYTQSFDGFYHAAASGAFSDGGATNATGWAFSASRAVVLGTTNTGGIHAVLVSGTDYALGSLGSGTATKNVYGLVVQNTTGNMINSLTVGFTEGGWQNTTTTDVATFNYSVGATNISTAPTGWNVNTALNLTAPTFTPAHSAALSGLNWASGSTLVLQWTDVDSAGTDSGMWMNNFTMSGQGTPSTNYTFRGANDAGTSYNWDTTSANNNWQKGSPAASTTWVDDPSSNAIFNNTDSAGSTVSLSGDRTMGTLTLSGKAYTFSNNNLNIYSGITATESATISSNVNAASGQNWSVDTAKTLTLTSGVNGTGTLTKTGAGTLDLTATSGVNGVSLTIAAGTVIVNSTAQLGVTLADVTVSGTLQINYGYQQDGSHNFVVNSGGIFDIRKDSNNNNPNVTFEAYSTPDVIVDTGHLKGSGNLVKNGNGTLILGLGGPAGITGDFNAGTGAAVVINAGTIEIKGVNAVGSSRLGASNINVNAGGSFQIGDASNSVALGSTTASSTGYIDLFDGGTLVVGGNSSLRHVVAAGDTSSFSAVRGTAAQGSTAAHINSVTVSTLAGAVFTVQGPVGQFDTTSAYTAGSNYSVIHVTGQGTTVLAYAAALPAANQKYLYAGDWSIDSGTLEIQKPVAGTDNAFGQAAYVNVAIAAPGTVHIDANTGANGVQTLTNAGTLSIDALSTLTTNSIQSPSSGTLNLAGTLTLTAPTRTASSLNTLNISTTGIINLGGSDLIVHSSSVGALLPLTQGSAPQITSSSLVSGLTTLVVLSGSDYLALGSSTLDSATVLPTDTIIRRAYFGDANLSGLISADDYLAIDLGYMFGLSGWAHGDFDQNGTVDPADFAAIDLASHNQGSSVADGEIALHTQWFGAAYTDAFNALSAPAAVPEPASMALLALAAPSLLTRRRATKSLHK